MRRISGPVTMLLGLALATAACSAGQATPAGTPAAQPTPTTAASASPDSPGPTTAPASGTAAPCAVAAAGTDGAEVTIAGFAFGSPTVTIAVGQAVTWTNRDGAPHTATMDGGECGTPRLARGESSTLVFTVAGTYTYHCAIHREMTATLEVTG